MNETPSQETAAQCAEIQVASVGTEALDAAGERCGRPKAHQRAEPAHGPDIPRREHVEATEATQQHQAGAPGTDARQLDERPECIVRVHARDPAFGQLTGRDRPGQMAERLGLPGAQAALPQRLEASLGDGLSRRKRMEAMATLLEVRAKALDESAHDGYPGIQAQLLEGHHVGERLEPLGKPRRPHAPPRHRRGAEPAIGFHDTLQRDWIHIEAEHLS